MTARIGAVASRLTHIVVAVVFAAGVVGCRNGGTQRRTAIPRTTVWLANPMVWQLQKPFGSSRRAVRPSRLTAMSRRSYFDVARPVIVQAKRARSIS